MVVPITVELVSVEINGSEIAIRYLDTSRIGIGINFGMHFKAGLGDGSGDETDHDLNRGERLASPVLTDEAE